MSNIAVKGATTGTGTFTLESPATNTDRTLVLPDEAGTVLTTAGVPSSALPAGSVLQVVNVAYATQTANASNTYADTGLTASITCASTASKVLVLLNQAGCGKNVNNTRLTLKLMRDATNIVLPVSDSDGYTNSTAANFFGAISACYLDSPASTSALTYKTQFLSYANNDGVSVQTNGATSTITLIEIAA